MRVLVYGIAADKLGGIETFLFNMNKFMSDDTIFDYVVEGVSTIHEKTIFNAGGQIYFIAPKKTLFRNISDWFSLLKKYKSNSNILYLNLYSLAWIFPVIIGRILGYKVIVHAHNNNLHDCGFLQRFLHAFNRFILGFVNIERYTNSELSSKFFFGNKKSEMIYNAIDTNRFAYNQEVRDIIRDKLNINKKNVYGFSGRIAYQKNPLFLIDIFSEIKKLDSEAAFLVCGDGDLMDSAKAHAIELGVDVLFLGSVNNIQDYYQAMDCYILPSRFEGLGIVLIEAQCSGLPCITSKYVVPNAANISDIFTFISLETTANEWASYAYRNVKKEIDRNIYSEVVKNTPFNICSESKRLERKLIEKEE